MCDYSPHPVLIIYLLPVSLFSRDMQLAGLSPGITCLCNAPLDRLLFGYWNLAIHF